VVRLIARDSMITGTTPTITSVSDGSRRLAQALVGRHLIGDHRQRVEVEGPQHECGRQFLHHVDEDQERCCGQRRRQQRQVHPTKHLARAAAQLSAPTRPSPA
jgi:hypothetical protein